MNLRREPVLAYYLATPLFVVLDFATGFPVRVAALTAPAQRVAYYTVVFALGWVCRARPSLTPWVGMLESAANLTLLLLSILLPIWSLPDAVASGGTATAGLDLTSMLNALLVGGALVLSFHRNQHAATRRSVRADRSR